MNNQLTIAKMREILDSAVADGMTEETGIVFSQGDLGSGGTLLLAAGHGTATRTDKESGEDVDDIFIEVATPRDLFTAAMKELTGNED